MEESAQDTIYAQVFLSSVVEDLILFSDQPFVGESMR